MHRKGYLLAWLAISSISLSASAYEQRGGTPAGNPPATEKTNRDYENKLTQPTTCGNHPYLASFGPDYRKACDAFSMQLQQSIRAAGFSCDHISLLSPTLYGTTAAEAMCVVPVGDVVLGLQTHIVNYLVLSKRVERLPADRIEAKAAIEAAIRKSIASEQDAYRQGEQARQNARQQHIELRRKSTVAGDLSVRGKRCDTLLAVEKTGAGEFTSTCLVKGKQKQYKSYFSGLD